MQAVPPAVMFRKSILILSLTLSLVAALIAIAVQEDLRERQDRAGMLLARGVSSRNRKIGGISSLSDSLGLISSLSDSLGLM